MRARLNYKYNFRNYNYSQMAQMHTHPQVLICWHTSGLYRPSCNNTDLPDKGEDYETPHLRSMNKKLQDWGQPVPLECKYVPCCFLKDNQVHNIPVDLFAEANDYLWIAGV